MNKNLKRYHRYFLFMKKREIFQTSAVFTISMVPEHTFVERHDLSNKIDKYLKHPDGVLLFLGYSKSGKTVFRQKHFENTNFKTVIFRPGSESTIQDLYDQISSDMELRLTSEIISSNSDGVSQNAEGGWQNKGIGKLIFRREKRKEVSQSITEEFLKPKINVNFLCNKLSDGNVLVIIEDYHLLSESFSKKISTDIKHFLDQRIFFLIIGVPSAANRSLKYNPDLSGRMIRVIFDYLKPDEVREIIKKGCDVLNVNFSEEVIERIIKNSFCNAYLVQFICQKLLINKSIHETNRVEITISNESQVDRACKDIINSSLKYDYGHIKDRIEKGFREQTDDTINQYREVLRAISHFDISKLDKGIYYTDVLKVTMDNLLKQGHEDSVEFRKKIRGQIKHAFKKINNIVTASVDKPILHLDGDKLYINDLLFKFYLDWIDDVEVKESKPVQTKENIKTLPLPAI